MRAAQAENRLKDLLRGNWLKSGTLSVGSTAGNAAGPPELLLVGAAFLAGLVAVWMAGQRRRRGGHIA